jgi:hypothetical protein
VTFGQAQVCRFVVDRRRFRARRFPSLLFGGRLDMVNDFCRACAAKMGANELPLIELFLAVTVEAVTQAVVGVQVDFPVAVAAAGALLDVDLRSA